MKQEKLVTGVIGVIHMTVIIGRSSLLKPNHANIFSGKREQLLPKATRAQNLERQVTILKLARRIHLL